MYKLLGLFLVSYLLGINSTRQGDEIIKGSRPKEFLPTYLAIIKLAGAYLCSGCLISELFVLSTAQCILEIINHGDGKFTEALILVGLSDLSLPQESIGVKNVAYPEEDDFSGNISPTMDIGLILVILSTIFDF